MFSVFENLREFVCMHAQERIV